MFWRTCSQGSALHTQTRLTAGFAAHSQVTLRLVTMGTGGGESSHHGPNAGRSSLFDGRQQDTGLDHATGCPLIGDGALSSPWEGPADTGLCFRPSGSPRTGAGLVAPYVRAQPRLRGSEGHGEAPRTRRRREKSPSLSPLRSFVRAQGETGHEIPERSRVQLSALSSRGCSVRPPGIGLASTRPRVCGRSFREER